MDRTGYDPRLSLEEAWTLALVAGLAVGALLLSLVFLSLGQGEWVAPLVLGVLLLSLALCLLYLGRRRPT